MSERWPPEGYSTPQEYQKNERRVIGFGILLMGVFGILVISPVTNGVKAYQGFLESIGTSLGVTTVPGSVEAVIAVVGLLVLFHFVVIPFHEAIHYGVGHLLNLNPDFGYEEGLLLDNPRVVALSTEIPVWKNLTMIVAPFAIIGVLSWGLIQVSSGILAGVAADVLWVNSAASAQDLYHYLRLVRMDPETLFANFEQNGEIRTEYAVPE